MTSPRQEIKKKGEAGSKEGRSKKIAEDKKNEQTRKEKSDGYDLKIQKSMKHSEKEMEKLKKGAWIIKRRRAVCVNCLKRNA